MAPPPSQMGAGTVAAASFYSKALGVPKNYDIYRPARYATSKIRYPVIYLLHGLWSDESNWTKRLNLNRVADRLHLPAIVVMPDGDDSFYVNWVGKIDYAACTGSDPRYARARAMHNCVKTPRYEDYIVNDLVQHIDATERTIANRKARAIGGFSMGGYGALMLAMRHTDIFSSAASHSGIDALLYQGPNPYVRGQVVLAHDPAAWIKSAGRLGQLCKLIFGTDIKNWRAHDPSILATKLHNGELAIYLDCGTEDIFDFQNGASYLHEVLNRAGVQHSFSLLAGGHTFAFWRSRIEFSLAFHMAHFRSAGVWSR